MNLVVSESESPFSSGFIVPDPSRRAVVGQDKGSGMILVVDDDPAVRSSLAKLLRFRGYEVATEENAAGVLEAVRLLRPDVILLDVKLPDLDGFEVCRRLRADPETRLVPIVLVTGLSEVDDRVRELNYVNSSARGYVRETGATPWNYAAPYMEPLCQRDTTGRRRRTFGGAATVKAVDDRATHSGRHRSHEEYFS